MASQDVPLSVVIPVFNSESSLRELISRVNAVLDHYNYSELVCVDDGSSDNSWNILKEAHIGKPNRIKIVRLLRNYGQHNALLCGFSVASGEILVTIDDDLQNPPEDIPRLLEKIEAGFDLVIGSYPRRDNKFTGRFVDWTIRRIFDLPFDFRLTSFRAVRKSVIQEVIKMENAFPYVTAMLLTHCARFANVEVRHDSRKYGTSNFSFLEGVRLTVNLLITYSRFPIWLVGILLMISVSLAAIIGLWVVTQLYVFNKGVDGWASSLLIGTFMQTLTILIVALSTLFLSRLYRRTSRITTGFGISERYD